MSASWTASSHSRCASESFIRRVAKPAPAEELPEAGRRIDPGVLAQAAAEVGIEILGPPGALPA